MDQSRCQGESTPRIKHLAPLDRVSHLCYAKGMLVQVNEREITCVLVKYPNGEEIWEDLREYKTNPTPGTFIVKDRRFKGLFKEYKWNPQT